MFDGKFRTPIDKAVKPIGDGLRKTGLTPDHLTIVGLVVGAAAAFAIGAGELRIGLVLVILAVLAADFAGQNDPKTAATVAALESHAELTASDILSVLPAFDHIKDDTVPRRLLEGLDRRGLATPAVLQALGRLHAREGRYAESRAVLERAAAFRARPPFLAAGAAR